MTLPLFELGGDAQSKTKSQCAHTAQFGDWGQRATSATCQWHMQWQCARAVPCAQLRLPIYLLFFHPRRAENTHA